MGEGGRFPLEEWFWEMPVCTRLWTTATVLTSTLVQCKVINVWQLFYSYRAVFENGQVRETRILCPPDTPGRNAFPPSILTGCRR